MSNLNNEINKALLSKVNADIVSVDEAIDASVKINNEKSKTKIVNAVLTIIIVQLIAVNAMFVLIGLGAFTYNTSQILAFLAVTLSEIYILFKIPLNYLFPQSKSLLEIIFNR
jgi:hypothetical protein